MRLIVISVLVALSLVGLTAVPAAAGGSGQVQINTGGGWSRDVSTPLFALDNIAPGWRESKSFEVRNASSTPTDIALQSADIVERENGCVHGEARVDTTCGLDQGELGHALRFTVNVGSAVTPVWSGTLYDLAMPVVIDPVLPANGTETVRITAALPWATGDEIETDTVGFDLQVDAQQDLTQVLGESVHRGGAGTAVISGAGLPSSGRLAMTGFDLLVALAGALSCLGAGSVLIVVAGSRRRGRSIG